MADDDDDEIVVCCAALTTFACVYLSRYKRRDSVWVQRYLIREQVTLRLNFTLKVTVRANIYRTLYTGMVCITTVPLEVFTQRNFVADFIRLKLTFTQKRNNRFLGHP